MDETSNEVSKGVTPGWYTNAESGLQQYWDGSTWSEIPAPTHIDGQPVSLQKSETSDLAVIALVFSFLVPFVGWILGFRARKEIADSQGKKTGGPLATAAIWIGAIVTVGVAAMIVLCALTSFAYDRHEIRFYDRGFGNYMFTQGDMSDFGRMMGSDQFGSRTFPGGGMMGADPSGSGSADSSGGMMFGYQGGQGIQPDQNTPTVPKANS